MAEKKKETKVYSEQAMNGKTMPDGVEQSRFNSYMRRCKECGVPGAVSRDHVWEEHGIILTRDSSQRMIIVERKIIDGVLNEVSRRLGGDIGKALLYAKAFDASRYARSLMSGSRRLKTGYPLLKKPFYELICDQMRVLGKADAALAEYKRGREVVVSCTHCYNRIYFAGDILGAVYAGEGREASIEVEGAESGLLFRTTVHENARQEGVGGHAFSWEAPLPGHVNYRRCKRCGTPFAVSFFSWDIPRGVMVDTRNGEQVAMMEVAGINAAYEEVKSELGEQFEELLAQEVKVMVDTILPGLTWKHRRPEDRIRDLFFLAYRGMGNPVFTESIEDGIMARVENPFNYPLVAGIATSFLARGEPVSFGWERPMPGRLEVYIHFK